jgi:hypothetical protein
LKAIHIPSKAINVPVMAVTTAIVLDWSNTAPWCAWDEEEVGEVGDGARGVLVDEGVLVGGEVADEARGVLVDEGVLVGGEVLVTGEFPVAEKGRDEGGVADRDRGVLAAGELLVV